VVSRIDDDVTTHPESKSRNRKQRERQLREAHKLDLQAKKTAKQDSRAEQSKILKEEVRIVEGRALVQ
jgi:hypothetical protein